MIYAVAKRIPLESIELLINKYNADIYHVDLDGHNCFHASIGNPKIMQFLCQLDKNLAKQKNKKSFLTAVKNSIQISLVTALLISIFYLFLFKNVINILTDIEVLRFLSFLGDVGSNPN